MSKLRYGIVGGGEGSFIGVVHRNALALSGQFELVCACFSRDSGKNQRTAASVGLDAARVYDSFAEMAAAEAARSDKPDFMVVTTRNDWHFEACKAFLETGFHVMCEKPLATNTADALELKRIAKANDLLLAVSYTYSGHVMAMDARNRIRRGEIGDILMVMGEYPQDWLLDMADGKDHGIATWRIDPKIAGGSNCIGDIGTHIEHTVSFMTGLKIVKLCAVLDKVGEGTELDNNAAVLLKFDNGATGCYWCSQVAAGYDNALKVRIFGTNGAVEFDQEASNYLKVVKKSGPVEIHSRGRGYVTAAAAAYAVIPAGHPEGYHNAFANLYLSFAEAVKDKQNGTLKPLCEYDFATVDNGIEGVRFIEACLQSASAGGAWVDL
ncbi:MAG: Gfo/Idh/MocA family oxidoreductase [Oscillospiraceae bacterium]|nr:Gfo/Idh/MocA family oxidoreductase [Oscillospiraceae bacterium]